MTPELLTAAAQAANLLAEAVRQAHQTANKADARLLEIALREPLRQARALESALAEIAEAAVQ